MKKNVIKTAFAAVCVVAAGVSGMKAYNVANQSQTNMLLAENVEALSDDIEDLEMELFISYPCWDSAGSQCTHLELENGKIVSKTYSDKSIFVPINGTD